MTSVRIDSNLTEVQTNLQTATDRLEDVLELIFQDAGKDAHNQIRADWPSDSGTSQEAWSLTTSGTDIQIQNPTEYAGFVHGGDAAATAEAAFSARMSTLTSQVEAEVVRLLSE